MSDTGLQARLQALITEWDGQHADWCCSRGCSSPDGRHPDDNAVLDYLARRSRGEDPGELATMPCTGGCSCHVGLYLTALRAALEAEA